MLAMGIDIGTTSLSFVLMDGAEGAVVARDTVDHGAFLPPDAPGGRIQDPEKLWRLVRERADVLVRAHGRPSCVGLTGQMHGMLYVDAAGRAVSPLYTWQDGRAGQPLPTGESAVEALRARGCAAAPGYGLATHCHLARLGRVPADAAKLTTISDYVAMRLTGNREPLIGADMAASWGAFDLRRDRFRTEALETLGVDPRLLPAVTRAHAIVGETPEGVPVMRSLGDNQASVLGSVRDLNGTALINIGTGSQVSLGVDGFLDADGGLELRPCGERGYILVGSGLCGGRAYAMLERFYREASGQDEPCYDRMLDQAREFVDRYGAEAAWKVRTTFSGTRADPGAGGAITGIRVENFRPGALTAGVIAGILEELREAYGAMCALTGSPAARLVGSGNGLRRNPLMRAFAQRLFGLPLRVPAHREEAACGAALCALAASGRVPSLEAAQRLIRYEE